jgi:hypothetical protein
LATAAIAQMVDAEHVGLLHEEYDNENGAMQFLFTDGHKV